MARVLISAGFDGAPHAIAKAELLRRAGHAIAGVLVVSPFGLRRARAMLRQRGLAGLLRAARRLLPGGAGGSGRGDGAQDPLAHFLRERGIAARSLEAWCRQNGVPRHVVPSLNDEAALRAVRAARADGLVYDGGGILQRPVLEALDGRVLNAHSGRMPEIRGMNACEWSLLLGVPPTVTIHFIERGIDTGPVVERRPVPVEPEDDLERLRAKCTVAGIEGLVRNVDALARPLPERDPEASRSRQCFLMAPVLLELLDRRIARGEVRG